MKRFEGEFDVVGAQIATEYFSRTPADRLAHGYLFAGPEGAGKKTFALRLAKSMLCTAPKTTLLGYCNACPACRQVDAGTHPDIFTTSGTLKIGERGAAAGFAESEDLTARDIVRQLSLHSYAGGWRLVLLGDLDFRGTEAAANALLKFFEEPPPRVLVVATSATPERILPTIRSRLIELRFGPIPADEMRAVLARSAVEKNDIEAIVGLAQGNLARAFELAAEDGANVRNAAIEWFFNVAQAQPVDESWISRDNLVPGLAVIKTLARDWLALRVGAPRETLLAGDQSARLRELPKVDPPVLLDLQQAIIAAERLARTNVAPPMVLMLLKMRIASSAF